MPVVYCLLVLAAPVLHAGPVPPELAKALDSYRTEGAWGWAFTQTTVAEDRVMVERYDPAQPDFQRWALLQKDGRDPTEKELQTYREQQSRRAGGETAPNVKEQLDRDTCELLNDDGVRATWRFGLVPGGSDDSSAEHMHATFTLHRPTGTIERVELASYEPFSPVLLVKVQEARTILHYSLPEAGRPSLLQEVTMRVRGRAMFFRSLDSDLTVTYSDHTFAGKQPETAPATAGGTEVTPASS